MARTAPSEGAAGRVVRAGPLRTAVLDAIRDMIVAGELEAGRHLVETELAEQLGVSRQPVREALQSLQQDGWVDLHPGFGAFVHAPTDDEASQLLEVRTMLEVESIRLAAHRQPVETGTLRELCDRGRHAVDAGDTAAVTELNAAFHAEITRLSGNAVLAELSGRIARRVRWFHTPVAGLRGRDSWDEHLAMVEALEARDEDRACALMREHVERTRRSYFAHRSAAAR